MAARINNFIYYSRLGLVRTVSVLKTVISRFEYKSDKDLIFPLISLLGYFLNSKKITLKDILMSLVDWRNDEWDLDSPVSLPTQSILVNLKGLAKSLETGETFEYSLPNKMEREDLAEENELLLSDMIILHALSTAKLIEANFVQWEQSLSTKLFGSFSSIVKDLIKEDKISFDPKEFLMELLNNYGCKYDPATVVDDIERIAIKQAKIHNNSIDQALLILEDVENLRRI
jgi:hypothetical protein